MVTETHPNNLELKAICVGALLQHYFITIPTLLLAGIAYLSLKVFSSSAASSTSFETNVLGLCVTFVTFCCHNVLELPPIVTAEIVGCAGCFLLILTSIQGLADCLALAAFAAFVSRPPISAFQPDTLLSEALAAQRDVMQPAPKSFYDRVVRNAQDTVDGIVASMAIKTADIVFYDLYVLILVRVTFPKMPTDKQETPDSSLYCIGAFQRWINVLTALSPVHRWLTALFSDIERCTGRPGKKTMLVRIPEDAKMGQQLWVVTPLGKKIEYIVNAPPGTLAQVSYS